MTTAVAPNTLNYAFDPYGTSPANKIVDEYHIITPDNSRKFNLLIPLKAPFFATGFQATLTSGATPLPLIEGVHFNFAFEHMSASRKCSKPIYGGIIFVDEFLSGTIRIDQYQTLGGSWTLDEAGIAEIMANTIYNPRTATWEKINGLLYQFPTIDHEHNVEDLGMGEVVGKLDEIKDVLATGGSGGGGGTAVTKESLGLDLVPNLPLADDPTATAALSRLHLMSPMGVRLAILSMVLNDFNAFVARRDNPNVVTAAQVGAYTIAQINSLLAGYLEVDGVAADSMLFNGKTPAQYMAQVLAGTAANAALFNGMTVEQLAGVILMGTAANATHFDGLTVEQLLAQVAQGTSTAEFFAGQIRTAGSANAANQDEYIYIADGRGVDDLEYQDGFLLIAGGNKRQTQLTPLWLLRFTNNLGSGAGDYGIDVVEITNTGIAVDFGVRKDIISNPADPKIEIWMKGTSPMDELVVTALTRDAIVPVPDATFTLVAPDQTTWTPPTRGVWNSQKLGGSTLAQVIAAAQAGTAANSLLFDGLTPIQYMAAVLAGNAATATLAANATNLGGSPAADYTLETELITALGQLKTYLAT